KSGSTQIMVAISAFGMGINSNNIRVVIHTVVSITNFIQEIGCVGHDGNIIKHFIFYSKKDICTNYSII
ncbi:hypothetical protein C1645_661937, partial [Glomus cerebriforme]